MSNSDALPRKRFPVPLAQVRRREGAAPGAPALLRPQGTVRQAATRHSAQGAPAGLGLDSAAVRARMVQRLREAGLRDERVLAAFAAVERHRFVDTALANQAYEDTSLPIGLGQTISKPSVVGQMLEALLHGRAPRQGLPLGRVLEIGTGCGYQAALLAQLAERVVSVERLAPLAEKARTNLAEAGVDSVEVRHGDGRLGAPEWAPFDAIVSAAGGDELPAAWAEQLARGGRLVAPVGLLRPGVQQLLVCEAGPRGLVRSVVGEVYFVPLKSGAE